MNPALFREFQFLKSNCYQRVKLKEVAKINPSTTFGKITATQEISFIPMEAVSDVNGVVENNYLRPVAEYKGYTRFKDGDVIWAKITPCMQNGKSAVVRNLRLGIGFGSTEFHVIRPSDKLLAEYIHFLLRDERLLQTATNFFSGSAGQQRVPADFLEGLLIPLPPLEIQRAIVERMNAAYAAKRERQAEARALLESIDAYILGRLGITLPEEQRDTTFRTSYRNVLGGRLDPYYHQRYFDELNDAVTIGQYPVSTLQKELSNIISGSRPSGGVSSFDSGVLSFGGEHINDKCEIEVSSPKFIPLEYHKTHLNSATNLFDILLVKDGATTGKIGILTDSSHVNQNINEHVFILRFTTTNPFYAVNLLHTNLYHSLFKQKITGATVTGLTKKEVRALSIPLPPMSIQEEIAAECRLRRERARELEQSARAIVEEAKREVERMITGEA